MPSIISIVRAKPALLLKISRRSIIRQYQLSSQNKCNSTIITGPKYLASRGQLEKLLKLSKERKASKTSSILDGVSILCCQNDRRIVRNGLHLRVWGVCGHSYLAGLVESSDESSDICLLES